MKKLTIVIALVAILGVGTAFADNRPSGFGIGVVSGGSSAWGGTVSFDTSLGLALAAADTYWGIRVGGFGGTLFVGVTGDFLTFMSGSFGGGPFGFYIDGGLFGNVWLGNNIALGGGARLPIGLSFNFNDFIDIWLAVVPAVGVHVTTGGGDALRLGGGWGPELGLRVWF